MKIYVCVKLSWKLETNVLINKSKSDCTLMWGDKTVYVKDIAWSCHG